MALLLRHVTTGYSQTDWVVQVQAKTNCTQQLVPKSINPIDVIHREVISNRKGTSCLPL